MEHLRPDLLIRDISMPGMGGYELADAVRSRPHVAHTPIVFLTASLQRKQRDEALSRGGSAVLAKLFNVVESRLKVDGLLARLFVVAEGPCATGNLSGPG